MFWNLYLASYLCGCLLHWKLRLVDTKQEKSCRIPLGVNRDLTLGDSPWRWHWEWRAGEGGAAQLSSGCGEEHPWAPAGQLDASATWQRLSQSVFWCLPAAFGGHADLRPSARTPSALAPGLRPFLVTLCAWMILLPLSLQRHIKQPVSP